MLHKLISSTQLSAPFHFIIYGIVWTKILLEIIMGPVDNSESNSSGTNSKWTDRERVLMLCSRGSLARTRHLVNDLKRLMPHVHGESKYGKNGRMADDLNEMCELSNCTKCLYFESRKGRDVYLVRPEWRDIHEFDKLKFAWIPSRIYLQRKMQ